MGGLVKAIFGGNDQPDMPTRQIQNTGQMVAEKAAGSFEENTAAKATARTTARRGTTQFRIPLAQSKTGAKTGGGAGLKI